MLYHTDMQFESESNSESLFGRYAGRPRRPAAERAIPEIRRIAEEEAEGDNHDSQYLNARKLRMALGGKGKGGEAHHIILGNKVQSMGLDQISDDYPTEEFNEAWNGILLDGTKSVHLLKGDERTIAHRKNVPQHNRYDGRVQGYINRNRSKDLKTIAAEIESIIGDSSAEYLDDMVF